MSRKRDVGRATVLAAVALAVVAGTAGGVVAARLHSHSGTKLPEFHGQQTWAARARPAPGFALRNQDGARISLASLRGEPVLLTFLDSQCTSNCPLEARALTLVLRRVPAAQRPTLVIVSVDRTGDTPASIAKAMKKWRLVGPWKWHWLNGTQAQLADVWRDYGIEVEPTTNDILHGMALYLIDPSGFERTGYLYPFLTGFLTTDLKHLAA